MLQINHTVSYNPASGEAIGHSKLNEEADVKQAIQKARIAQSKWAQTTVKERAAIMRSVRDYVVAHADEIAAVISRDNGKTRTDAMVTEVAAAAMATEYYAKNARRFLKDKRIRPGNLLLANKASKIVRIPFGIIGIISPWNYPFSIPFSEIIMALVAGNAVILKVATETQMVGRVIEDCITSSDLPDGLFTYLNLPGRVAGELFLKEGVDKLFFTGSVAVGKQLMQKASETLTPVSLELGGNDAMIVLNDADLNSAAAGAVWAGMQNAGQSCGGVERVYVHESVFPDFIALLKERVEKLRIGDNFSLDVDIGAMTTTKQLQTVQFHIEDALTKGAVIAAQSRLPNASKGYFAPATVLTQVDHNMRVMREETFGPVLGVMPFKDIEQAIDLANDSDLGLTGSVWSKDRQKAEYYGRRVKAGVIMINDHLMSHGLPETPWGGVKSSGIGRTHGEMGFAEMTEPQCIVQDYMPGLKKNLWWYPHTPDVYLGMKGMLDFLYNKSLWKRIIGGIKLTKVFLRIFKS